MKRIVQIIDSLEIGGAERMAVNYANALASEIEFSGLIATRKEGDLKQQLDPKVNYLFLGKKRVVDFRAIYKLKAYCLEHEIEFLHAHSSSYWLATLMKMAYPPIKIIWHDHNGMSEFLGSRESLALRIMSFIFKGIIVVNNQLFDWAQRELNCKNVIYLANFTEHEHDPQKVTSLQGNEGKRILCLANLRLQKNHFLLLDVAEKLKESHPDWSFHLVGKDFEDDYSRQVRSLILTKKLEDTVFVYGSKSDTNAIISQADIAILTSKSEGLPVALLEFGLNKKPVIVTNVGEIPLIIQNRENGFIVPSQNAVLFYEALVELVNNPLLREQFGAALFKTINANNSQKAVIGQYLNWVEKL